MATIKQKPLINARIVAVIAIVLVSLLIVWVLWQTEYESPHFIQPSQQTVQLSLKKDISSARFLEIFEEIKSQPKVISVVYISPTRGIGELEEQGGYGDGSEFVPQSAALPVIEVQYQTEASQDLMELFKKIPEVESSKIVNEPYDEKEEKS